MTSTVAYAIAHVAGVLVEETLLPLVCRVGFWTSGDSEVIQLGIVRISTDKSCALLKARQSVVLPSSPSEEARFR
jgi:hypothetical protein